MDILEELVYFVFHCHYCMGFLRPCCWNQLCCWPLKPSPVIFWCRWSSYVNTSKYGSCLMDGSSVTSLTAFSPWTWWRLCRSQGTSSLPKWLEWTVTTISAWDREKCTFSYQTPGWFCWTGTVSFSFADMFEIHFFFFSNTCSKIADMAGPDRPEGLCWGTVSVSQTARLMMLCSIQYLRGSLMPQTWSSILCCGLAVTLVTRTGHCAGTENEKRELGYFLVSEQASLGSPNESQIIRRELLVLEALLNQHELNVLPSREQ